MQGSGLFLAAARCVLAGVEIADSEADCPVEYYTLQGVRVNTPAKGDLLIRRQGTKVSKVIIGANE